MGFDRYAKRVGILSFVAMFLGGIIVVVPSWLELNHGDGQRDRAGLFHYCVEIKSFGDFSEHSEKCKTVGWILESTENELPDGTNRIYIEFTVSRISLVLGVLCIGYIGVRTLCFRIEARYGYDSYVITAAAFLCIATSALLIDIRRNAKPIKYIYYLLGATSEPDENVETNVQFSICWQVSWVIILGIMGIQLIFYLGKKHLREEVYDAYEHRRLQVVD